MTKALVVDQNLERAKNTEFYLQQEGYRTAIAKPGKSCKTTCAAQLPDIILLSVGSWQDDTINTLIELKSNKLTKSVPVLVIATCADPQTLIYSLDLGAHECVPEPIVPQVLAARIRSILVISRKQKHLELTNQELLKLASTDALTHVNNRRYFFAQSQAEFARAKRYGRDLSVIMLDIDEFKMVNDKYGHAAGDIALVSLAECCRSTVRESDIVGRLGGEEFAICCPETAIDGAKVIAERIRKTCEQTLLTFNDQQFCITVSLGITQLSVLDDDLETIMQRSDKLLYSAKDLGRNCAVASELMA
jgi:diguanylate cyclase (GGDEF)-like protein